VIFAVYGVVTSVLLYTLPDIGFLPCFTTCHVPTEIYSSVYLFIATILYIKMAKSTAYVFYIVPRSFNARLIRGRMVHANSAKSSTNLINLSEHPNNEQSDIYLLGGQGE